MCNEIMKSQTDGSFAIVVSSCASCPYVASNHCGKEYTCNHPKAVVAKPYARDRRVKAHNIDAGCVLLPPAVAPVKVCTEKLCSINKGICFECEAYKK